MPMISDAYISRGELVLVGDGQSLEVCEALAARAEDAEELRYTYDPELARPTLRVLLEGLSDERAGELVPDEHWALVSEELV